MIERKILLFLVEGKSDEASLAPALEQIVAEKAKFKIMSCDITSDLDSTPKNIESRVRRLGVKRFLKKNSQFRESDLCGVVHIVDTDGVFANDDLVQKDDEASGVMYYKDKILERSEAYELFLKSRTNKRANLSRLLLLRELKLKDKLSVPYEVYYNSCNLDHVLHDKRNCTKEEKRLNSEKFALSYSDPAKFIAFFEDKAVKVDGDYLTTWNFIKEGNNSLMRHSNLSICIKRHRGAKEDSDQKKQPSESEVDKPFSQDA